MNSKRAMGAESGFGTALAATWLSARGAVLLARAGVFLGFDPDTPEKVAKGSEHDEGGPVFGRAGGR